MNHIARYSAGIWFFVCCIVSPAANKPPCDTLSKSTLPEVVNYLKGDRSSLQLQCIEFAIDRIGQNAFAPGAEIVAYYLDFVKVPNPTYVYSHPSWMGRYPAAHALFAIGAAATPSLVRIIGSMEASEQIVRNAEDVLRMINRDNPSAAVAVLRRSSRSAPDALTSSRLFESAIRLSQRCPPDVRGECELALN